MINQEYVGRFINSNLTQPPAQRKFDFSPLENIEREPLGLFSSSYIHSKGTNKSVVGHVKEGENI